MERVCENCKFYRPYGTVQRGICGRYPPLPFHGTDFHGRQSLWSIVNAQDWCGEFRPFDIPLPMDQKLLSDGPIDFAKLKRVRADLMRIVT